MADNDVVIWLDVIVFNGLDPCFAGQEFSRQGAKNAKIFGQKTGRRGSQTREKRPGPKAFLFADTGKGWPGNHGRGAGGKRRLQWSGVGKLLVI